MKTINNFIIEHLKYSTFSINEKLKISSKSKFYSYYPKDKFELREILEKRLAQNKNADLNDIDVSEITDMGADSAKQGLFFNLDPHNIDISEWNVSNVTNMRNMFYGCENFNADLGNWDVSNVIDMEFMFATCLSFEGTGLEKWKPIKLKTMILMFSECRKLVCDLNSWNIPLNAKKNWAFDGCDSLKEYPKWYKK